MISRTTITPDRLIGTLIAFQFVILVCVPYAFSLAPPLDVVEGLVWAPHWLIGTYKHPPLPSWLIEISVLVTRDVILGPYLVSQICVALTYWFVYRLGRLFFDPINAAMGTVLMAGTYYFTVPTLEFNHNVIQLPLWSGTLLLFAHLRRHPDSWRLWISIGALGGIGLYGKYTFAILLIILLIASLYEPLTRKAYTTPKPYIAIAFSTLIFLPHFRWLIQNNFEPISYAIERAGGGATSSPLVFMLAQFADHLPMALLILAANIGLVVKLEKTERPIDDRNFLRWISFAPIVLTLVIFLVTGSAAKDMWGMPMFTPVGLFMVSELGRQLTLTQLARATAAALLLISLVGIGFIVQSISPYLDIPPRSNWPMRELSERVDELWQRKTGKPLSFIGGSPFIAGLAAIGRESRPSVMIGSTIGHSPWLIEEQVVRDGIIFLFQGDQSPPALCGNNFEKADITLSDPLIPRIKVILCPPKIAP